VGREAYRLMKDELETGYDLVLLKYPRMELSPVKGGTLAESAGELKTLFQKARLLRPKAE